MSQLRLTKGVLFLFLVINLLDHDSFSFLLYSLATLFVIPASFCIRLTCLRLDFGWVRLFVLYNKYVGHAFMLCTILPHPKQFGWGFSSHCSKIKLLSFSWNNVKNEHIWPFSFEVSHWQCLFVPTERRLNVFFVKFTASLYVNYRHWIAWKS